MLDDETEENIGNYEPYLINTTNGSPSYRYIPFIPGFNQSGYLDNQTIGLHATHNKDAVEGRLNETEFFIHNANGHMSLKRITNALKNITLYSGAAANKRILVLSESTFPGSGNLGGALITDVYRSWDNLKNTLSQVLQLSMAGVSNVVTDTCGSLGPLDEELCFRWAQLAVFLPMSRNYYNETYYDEAAGKWLTTDPSEFYNFKNAQYNISMAPLISQRLKFSRYIYS
jgi:alpha-glucosidase (family GH31 glycosyl hydrolase)